MVAVLEFIDGFGADTQVTGIYRNLEEAIANYGDKFHYKEFEFGLVEFDIYDCSIYDAKKIKKKRKEAKSYKKRVPRNGIFFRR